MKVYVVASDYDFLTQIQFVGAYDSYDKAKQVVLNEIDRLEKITSRVDEIELSILTSLKDTDKEVGISLYSHREDLGALVTFYIKPMVVQ